MKKLLKNPSSSEYVILINIGLTLGPGEEYELTGIEKLEWLHDPELLTSIRAGSIQVGYYSGSFYTNAIDGEIWFRTEFDETAFISNVAGTELTEFSGGVVQDTESGKKSSALFMNMLTIMKELYNSSTNPIYEEDFQPFIGTGGRELEHLARTTNLENIHGVTGWHTQQIKEYGIEAPSDVIFYYGWLNSFNSSINAWSNEKVAQDFARYRIVVLGNGLQDPTHGDYANTAAIVPRIKQLNPRTLVFGYVSCNQSLANFQTKVDQWEDLEIDGIFIDEGGYDYGSVDTNSRSAFNTKVDYVHGQTHSKLCFVNAWNMDHIIGTADDTSYPNSTWNSTELSSKLTSNDWYLLESFAINTASYSSNSGYESKTDWALRGSKAIAHRYTYGINLCGVGVINNDNSNGQGLFNFLYYSALMWALDAIGSSDTYYGASSATVTFWTRPNTQGMGRVWSLSPSVLVDSSDSDIYYRYTDYAKLSLDFSSGAQVSSVIRFSSIGTSGTSGTSGTTPSDGTSGTSGSSGTSPTATSGTSGSSGTSGTSSTTKGLTSNFTTTSNSATSTNLTFAVNANEDWVFECRLTTQCSSTGGIKYAISAPTGSTIEGWILASTSSITSNSYQRITAINTLNTTALHTASNVPGPDRIRFLIRIGSTAGNVTLQAASVTSGQTTTIFARSFMTGSLVSSMV